MHSFVEAKEIPAAVQAFLQTAGPMICIVWEATADIGLLTVAAEGKDTTRARHVC